MIYKILKTVNLRKTPRITPFNRVGRYETGREVDVLETIIDSSGRKWGQVTEADAHGQSIWFCIKTTNSAFAKPLDPVSIVTPSAELPADVRRLIKTIVDSYLRDIITYIEKRRKKL